MERMHYSNDNNTIQWFRGNGQHRSFRENGPCQINSTGEIYFSQLTPKYVNRKRGPAIIHPDGGVAYNNRKGQCHRTDGPAIIRADGSREYRIDGNKLSSNEFFLKYGVL